MAQPNVFLCFPRASDEDGKIERIRELVEKEIRLLTGELDFKIFKDVTQGLGQNWARVLRDDLSQVDLLLPFVQPALFTDEACRRELEAFVQREAELGRDDLILPILYIDCDDYRATSKDRLRSALANRQCEDLRRARHASSAKLSEAAVAMARHIVDVFRRIQSQTTMRGASTTGVGQTRAREASAAAADERATPTGATPSAANRKLRVLLLAANPNAYDPTDAKREQDLIEKALRATRTKFQQVQVNHLEVLNVQEFLGAISSQNPEILHFSGHGNANGEPMLLAVDGSDSHSVSGEVLEAILKTAPNLRCVVLNTCYSARVAKVLVRRLPITVMGMHDKLDEQKAQLFAEHFYRGIARGRDLRSAFDTARAALWAASTGDANLLPSMTAHFDIDPELIVLLPRDGRGPNPKQSSSRGGANEERGSSGDESSSDPPPISPENRSALIQMLLSMFVSGEFLRFLRYSSVTASLLLEIRSENASQMQVLSQAVDLLVSRELLDESFFDRLVIERPRREGEIRRMQARILRQH